MKKKEEEMEDGMALRDWEEGGQPRRGGGLSWQCQPGQAWKACSSHIGHVAGMAPGLHLRP